jgi:hypothetical protein
MTRREAPWYAQLREQWKPDRVRVLLVAESAPEPVAADRRFFYAPTITSADNLFRGVVEAMYHQSPGRAGEPKAPWLRQLRNDGVYLVDVCPHPVNHLASRERRLAIREHAPALVAEAAALEPAGVIVCHGPTFTATAQPLRHAGLNLLHKHPIPFPLGNWRARFALEVSDALARL